MGDVSQEQAGISRMSARLALVAVLMFGFGFALIPLYDTLCRVLDINGKVEQAASVPGGGLSATDGAGLRDVRVELVTTVNEQLDWGFYPLVNTVQARPGTSYTVLFHVSNRSDQTMTVQAIPSVTPTRGAKYLMKTHCFCFERQTLQAGETVKMPVVFYVDPVLPEEYGTLTLAYALFEVRDEPGQGERSEGPGV